MSEIATFGAGCFWGIEAAFQQLAGVIKTEVGYAGGTLQNPTYAQVCSHTTGHAEVVRIIFNPQVLSYAELLNFFWEIHNPTSLNRQGPDVGSQYRSVIFYHSDEQRQEAENSKKALQAKKTQEIVTEILPATIFYRAEEYHQRYVEKHR